MSILFNTTADGIGNTPLIRLNKLAEGVNAEVFVKMESKNPGFSVKDRIAKAMILDAIDRGTLRPGMSIIEPTSGNTGIALAMVGASLGYPVILVMPDTMSVERRKMMKRLGAHVELTPGAEGMKGAINRANELASGMSGKAFIPGQFDNPANPAVHAATTGPEIRAALGGNPDVFVAGVGTGGTISGVSRFFKQTVGVEKFTSVAVEPVKNPAISNHFAGNPHTPAPHKIQGIGAGFIPKNLDVSLLDSVETVDDDEAIETARKLFRHEGIMGGISSGANVAAALRLAKSGKYDGKRIVTIICDTGERYLSTGLFADISE